MSEAPSSIRYRGTLESLGLHFIWFIFALAPAGSALFLLLLQAKAGFENGVLMGVLVASVGGILFCYAVVPGVALTSLLLVPVLLCLPRKRAIFATVLAFPVAAFIYFWLVVDIGDIRSDPWAVFLTVMIGAVTTCYVYSRFDLFELNSRKPSAHS
jgi:hypothetical protein